MSQSGEIANQSNTSSCGFAPLRTTEEFFAVRYFRGRLLRLSESVDSSTQKLIELTSMHRGNELFLKLDQSIRAELNAH